MTVPALCSTIIENHGACHYADDQYFLRDSHPDVLGRTCAAAFSCNDGEFKAIVDIRGLFVSEGTLPRRATQMVLDWAELHQAELLADWELCQAKQHPKPIAPLP